MGTVYQNSTELIGHTPLVALTRLSARHHLLARILVKVEACNPGGSVKDRIAKAMIDAAEQEGLISSGSVIVEPTSGNTGIGLALVGASRGYRVILVMPDTMSIERRTLLQAYGAEVVLTDGTQGMKGAIAKAQELAAQIEGAWIPSQFTNRANPAVHRKTTGPEIWEDTAGNIDIFVAGVGTGGTITGVGSYLKTQNPQIIVVAVEPSGSPVLSTGIPGPHKIQGIGAGFIPETLDTGIYDRVMTVANEAAYETARELASCEGIFAGISSGAALFAAMELARDEAHSGKTIVVVLPDSGDRYLSLLRSS